MDLFVRWQSWVGAVRYKPLIGLAVLAAGVTWLVGAAPGAATAVPSFLAGLGAGIVVLSVGAR